MRLYSTAYLAYGIQIPDTQPDHLEDTLQALDNGVGYLNAGRFGDERTYLTTECHSADAGEYLGLAPETLNDRRERATWDTALKTAAEALGHSDAPAPGWFLTADLDN
ncbi:hypothetical protein [Streptomyces sp. NBC_01233]|uniref:hypothetical protein n=1 Tax=Streptomyces sp. NBC_01233 TaxID=2903787 RepID=UPI002E11FEB4|nr:hypothetical protein OG332_10580 [Streptomyces sp. NBC_01233]